MTDLFTAYSMQISRLICWALTNNIFSAKSSIDNAVCLISSPTCSWWLPSLSCIAGYTKSQDRSLKEKRHTFKSHICAGWKLVIPERLLEFILQGGTSDFSILLVFFVHIIYLHDEIVKFCEDRNNRTCSCQSL